jgi:di/tricarboxylate transporter
MVYTISILALVAIFTIATTTPINMGILAFAGAFVVGGWVSGIDAKEIIDAFPGSTFIIVGGITLLFAIAKANGTIDLVIDRSLRLVGGRRWAVLWMMFLLAGLLMALGSVLAVGMLAPIAMPLATKNKINPFLMGMVISHGALGCCFSPINLYGAFVNGMMKDFGIGYNPAVVFFIPFALNLLIALILFAIFGRDLVRNPRLAPESLRLDDGNDFGTAGPAPTRGTGTTTLASRAAVAPADLHARQTVPMTRYRFATLAGILVLVIGSVGFGIDVGVSAICVSAALLLLSPKSHPKVIDNVAWPAVVLVTGMLTYMAVLDQNGTLDFLGDAASALGSPLLTALVLCYAVAIISAFGSSIGTLGIALPLAAPLLTMGEIGALGFVAALAFSATVVDVSPFSTNGVMVLAEAEVDDKTKFQRKMLAYCALIVAVAPLVVWGLVVVPTSV